MFRPGGVGASWGHTRAAGAAVRWPRTDRIRLAVPAAYAVTCGDTAGTPGTAQDGSGQRQVGGSTLFMIALPSCPLFPVPAACRLTCGITAGTAGTAGTVTGGGAAQPEAGVVGSAFTE